jgi:hypothetical protein
MQHNSKQPFIYNVAIEDGTNTAEGQVVVDWGSTPHWIDDLRERLDNAYRIALIPKQVGSLPVVSTILDGDKRWLIGSRVCGRISGGTGVEMRIYFIGWQKTAYDADGEKINIKSVQWIYPGGAAECSDEPTLVDDFLNSFEARMKQ